MWTWICRPIFQYWFQEFISCRSTLFSLSFFWFLLSFFNFCSYFVYLFCILFFNLLFNFLFSLHLLILFPSFFLFLLFFFLAYFFSSFSHSLSSYFRSFIFLLYIFSTEQYDSKLWLFWHIRAVVRSNLVWTLSILAREFVAFLSLTHPTIKCLDNASN
jgi:hypothetical protein